MSFDLKSIQKGKIAAPFRVVCYGPEGVGKSSFAADAPSPIFIGTEDGTNMLDVARFPTPKTFDDVIAAISTLYSEDHEFKTVVLDSADWLEKLIADSICKEKGVKSIEDLGYGKGYKMIGEQFAKALGGFSALREAKQMHVIIIAHAVAKTFNDPTSDSYDHWTLATSEKHVTPQLKQWCDALLFFDFDKSVTTTGEGFNARTVAKSYGQRVMYASHRASHDAKNRYGMPDRLPLAFANFFEHYQGPQTK